MLTRVLCLLTDDALVYRVTKVIPVLAYLESMGFQADLAYLVCLEELSMDLEWKFWLSRATRFVNHLYLKVWLIVIDVFLNYLKIK